MRQIHIPTELDRQEFAKRAAADFIKNPKHRTFTDKDIESGCYFAVRWGMGDDCILVLQLSESEEPVIYTQIIKSTNQSEA